MRGRLISRTVRSQVMILLEEARESPEGSEVSERDHIEKIAKMVGLTVTSLSCFFCCITLCFALTKPLGLLTGGRQGDG